MAEILFAVLHEFGALGDLLTKFESRLAGVSEHIAGQDGSGNEGSNKLHDEGRETDLRL